MGRDRCGQRGVLYNERKKSEALEYLHRCAVHAESTIRFSHSKQHLDKRKSFQHCKRLAILQVSAEDLRPWRQYGCRQLCQSKFQIHSFISSNTYKHPTKFIRWCWICV